MNTSQILSIWSHTCSLLDVKWYLYKETLLCANGYHDFPEDMNYAHVAVFSQDLPLILESLVPLLPGSWQLHKSGLVAHKHLHFTYHKKTLLIVHILCPVESEEQMMACSDAVTATRRDAVHKMHMRNIGVRILGHKLGKPFARSKSRIIRKTFKELVTFPGSCENAANFYCEYMTKSHPFLMDSAWFENTVMIPCCDTQYPAFSGYKQYLEEIYGDFENGMTDEVGVGLTIEEKDALRQHQARCKEALAFLQELRNEFGLRYYLIAGSVLGPMRHGGFIPWDDDVDIGIRVEELEAFENIVKEELPKRLPAGFALEQPGADNPYPRMFSKICYDGRCCIDLWPLIPTYVHGKKARFTWYFAKVITKAHYYKIGHKVTKYYKQAKLIATFLSDQQIMALARWNEQKFVGKETPAYVNIYSIYRRKKETIPREWLDTPATLNFDGLEVPVVGCTKQYLVHLYGDYMRRPAPWKRISRHVARFNSANEIAE